MYEWRPPWHWSRRRRRGLAVMVQLGMVSIHECGTNLRHDSCSSTDTVPKHTPDHCFADSVRIIILHSNHSSNFAHSGDRLATILDCCTSEIVVETIPVLSSVVVVVAVGVWIDVVNAPDADRTVASKPPARMPRDTNHQQNDGCDCRGCRRRIISHVAN